MPDEMIYEIPLREIRVADTNVRQHDRDKELDELADNIKKYGLMQPVLLRGSRESRPPYDLIVGQRRYLAHQQLAKTTIRATFAGDMDDAHASIRSLSENLLRVDINHADAAKAVTNLYKHFGKDERRVAKETGMSVPRIRQYIYIQERASSKTKEKLRERKVSPIDVQRALKASVGDADKADELLNLMQKYKLTTYQKKRLVEYGETNARASAEKIVEDAKQPRVEQEILVKLSESMRSGLENASKVLSMEPDEVAATAIREWLASKGFAK